MRYFQLIPIKNEDILQEWFSSLGNNSEAKKSILLENIELEIGGIIDIGGKKYAFVYVEGEDIKTIDLPINKKHDEIKKLCQDGDIIEGEVLYRLNK